MHSFLFIFLLCIYYVWRKLLLYPFFPIAFFNSRLSRVKANETNANELRFWNRLQRSYTFEKETSYAIFWTPRTLTFLLCYAFILKADFGGIFMRKIFPLFPFLCCFRFLCYGVPLLLLLFLFCSIGLANTKFSLVCVILLVRSILLLLHYIRLFIVFLFLV